MQKEKSTLSMSVPPLKGVRVLDVSHAWAGPHCSQLLGDLGAEVIKIESLEGDLMRGSKIVSKGAGTYPEHAPGAKPWNRAGAFNEFNRNKLGISLNLNTKEGCRLFKELVKVSQILIENLRAGTMEKLGLGYEDLKKVKPDIIMVSLCGWGRSGPWWRYRTYGVAMEPTSGMFSLTGYRDDDTPMRSGVDHIDPVSGTHAAGAALAALLHHQKTGKGQYIVLSFLESAVNFMGQALLDYTANGRIWQHAGNRHRAMAPHGCYRCRGDDEWVTISIGTDEEWGALCRVMGNPAWTEEPKFTDLRNRLRNQDELDRRIEEWTWDKDKYEVMHSLQQAGVAAEAVLDMSDIYHEPHLRARGFFQSVAHPEAGTFDQFGTRAKLSKTPTSVRFPAPCYGEHRDYVFGELLGMTGKEIDELIKSNVIALEPQQVLTGYEF